MNVFLFNHSGSLNRGCEAIVRGTMAILDKAFAGNEYVLSSYAPQEDDELKDIVRVVPFKPKELNAAEHITAALKIRLGKDERYSIIHSYADFFEAAMSADVCLSVGGDTYCYGDNSVIRVLTSELKKRGKTVVLWGASIGKEDLDFEKEKNLACFDAIFVRESLTFELLKNRNINPNVFLFPDPAFTLEKEELPLPDGWEEKNTVGINVSSIVVERNPKLILIVADLIKHILKNTDMSVALVPHVTSANNNDMPALTALLNEMKSEDIKRVFILPDDLNSEQYKGYIARLKFFIGARTHATIAAYTSFVPTIVLGYSIKSRGIAKDLFGDELFVLNAQRLHSGTQLIESFNALCEQEHEIKKTLANEIPQKIRAAYEAGEKLKEI
ncbi:MAG: polysaccharide pyruvyl transferase family protein [Clostridiales bacterium]|nr:polysaccharide pyruvyl transferase family protein [Clostridiales bacterium]